MRCFLTLLACQATLLTPAASAQERSINFALTAGVSAAPEYFGADNTEVRPAFGLTFGSLSWGKVQIGNGIGYVPDNGLSFRGAFRVIEDRSAAESPELAGLQDIDTAVELGFGVTYRETNWQAFGEIRRGFGGHEGVTGTLGLDAIARPTDRWTLSAGPRVSFGNDSFANTYFGVTSAEAAASSFDAFNAEGGVLGVGLQLGATYALNDLWSLQGSVQYERLKNDAARSPITVGGSEDQWRVNIGVSRAFTLKF